MRKKVTVIGASETARIIAERDYADVVEGDQGLAGSDVVVLTSVEPSEKVAVHAPAAVVVVAADGGTCKDVLRETLFPRGRVIGVARAGTAPLVDSVVLDRGATLECLACVREAGDFVPATARIGERGIEAIL